MWAGGGTETGDLGMRFTNGFLAGAVLAAATAVAVGPVAAGSPDGNIEIKLLGTVVAPQEKIGAWNSSNAAVQNLLNGAGGFDKTGASVDNALIPSLSITYFFTKNLALETICCFTHHSVNVKGNGVLGANGLNQSGKVTDTWIFPPTLMLQYHFTGLGAIRPYVGVGASYFHFFKEKNGVLNSDSVSLKDDLGLVVGGGLDISLGGGWHLSADVKKYFIETEVRVTNARLNGVGLVDSISTKADLDPWVISAGIGYRFNWEDLFGHRRAEPMK